MIKRIDQKIGAWQDHLTIANSAELFLRVLYLFLLLNFIRLLPIADIIWGPDGFVILNKQFNGVDTLAFWMNLESVRPYYLVVILAEMSLLLLGVLGKHHFITRFLVFFLFVNIHNANHEVSNGGYNLIQQLLFFQIFWFKVKDDVQSIWASAKRLLFQLSFYAIWIQLCLLYASAGLFKLDGTLWLEGAAIAHVLSIEEYSHPIFMNQATTNPIWMQMASWVTLFYQILFPIAIWIKPIRFWFLLIGTGLHLSIAFVVGITDFGLIMVVSYLIFIEDQRASQILDRVHSIFNRNHSLTKV